MMRQQIRQLRRALKARYRHKMAQKLTYQVIRSISLRKKEKIALYLPFDGEIETAQLIKALQIKHTIYLPILVKDQLKFAKLNSNYHKNHFGIKEPNYTQLINTQKITLVFMPLVGFDEKANRLGMGGGFYDKSFANKNRFTKVYGLGFDCQKITNLKVNPWDVALKGVITPNTFISAKKI
jgi:5-formyltetrahydrofolate cyclo-ligase